MRPLVVCVCDVMSGPDAQDAAHRRRRSFNDSLGDMDQSVIEQLYRYAPTAVGNATSAPTLRPVLE